MLYRAKRLLNLAGDKLFSMPLLVLYLTDGCNSRCQMCDIWQNPRRNMPMPLVESIADVCSELGIRWILLSGGEAMQHPQWSQIAQRFRAEGVHMMLLTNGLFLRKQAEEVIASVDEVILSLDGGTAATYATIRGVDAFDVILEGVDSVRAGGVPVTTRTTVQQANFREIPQIIDVALAHDVTTISFLAIDVSNPFAFGDRDLLTPDGALSLAEIVELERIIETLAIQYADAYAVGRMAESPDKLQRILAQYFKSVIGEGDFPRPPCNAPHFSTVIEVDGRLRPCYFLPTYGRLQPDGETLSEAINWDAAQELRRAYRTGQRPECARCVCPLHKGTRALMRM
ncbi:MAG: radical SAM protein [Anaerolineae bacterium]|nr:radical SAM protein [Anaerolineae bacterium]